MFGSIYFGQTYFGGNGRSSFHFLTISESISLRETLVKQVNKPISDTIILLEVVTTLKVIFTSVTDSITLVEAITKSITKAIVENVTLNETISKIHTMFLTVTDSITLTENLTMLKVIEKVISESITLYEKLTGFLNGIMMFPWRDKYSKTNNTFSDKYSKTNNQWKDKYH